MNLDFSLILVVATAVTGLIWAVDAAFFRSARTASVEPGTGPKEPLVVEYARAFFPIFLLVLVVRSFLYEPFRIPSGSMLPTLNVGDFIFVNKYAYGLRLPVLYLKVLDVGQPQRGDVMVFRLPSDPSTNYIKRLIGLPGDTIRYVDRTLYINGEKIADIPEGTYEVAHQGRSILETEKLGNVEHHILLIPSRQERSGTYIVPPGHYFMMGDNRDNSQDSRFPQVGMVPEQNIVGKAVLIWMNWDFPHAPIWARIGSAIH